MYTGIIILTILFIGGSYMIFKFAQQNKRFKK